MLIPKKLDINPNILELAYSDNNNRSGILSATAVVKLDGAKLLEGKNLIDSVDRSVLPLFAPEAYILNTTDPYAPI